MNDSPSPTDPVVPHPEYDELHSALADDPAGRAHVEALRAELHADEPDRTAVAAHATRLRGIPVVEARIANWWDDPNTQRWVKAITDAGL
jgi:predicted component of type VI protein secretion system